ncbi:MAG: citramalate synthase [Candidatus Neomarinimicrobiota bacterium]|jgi:2-isopropylmalate synthase|nr:citramalate synthase [bacterium]
MNGKIKIHIFDTLLRDGTQSAKIAFSLEDKLRIAQELDRFGIDYIEGGWPGSNPKDLLFFEEARKITFQHARLVAFGSTRRPELSADKDPNLKALLDAGTPAVAIFGKSWTLHVKKALRISPEENLELIADSLTFVKSKGKELIYDAEHFFDGYKADTDYALRTLWAAEKAGADTLVLCDTNGGTQTQELLKIIGDVKKNVNTRLGIHLHNDSDLAVANTVAAVEAGCVHVQGTINGYGERCGNANLCSVIPNLQIKGNYDCIPEDRLPQLTRLSRFISELANMQPQHAQPFVGASAFAHKGGIHVSAVIKDASTYEHIRPETVGNKREVLLSDLSGRSNLVYKAKELGLDLQRHESKIPEIIAAFKQKEHEGYQYEGAEDSLKLLIKKISGEWQRYFELEGFRVLVEKDEQGIPRSEATVRLLVNGQKEHTAAEGAGPVHALDRALRAGLLKFYPEIKMLRLVDYKVRVINGNAATGAKVRVLIESAYGKERINTVGVSANIDEASWDALTDSVSWFLHCVTSDN